MQTTCLAHTQKSSAFAHRYAKLDKKMSQQLQKTRDDVAAFEPRGRHKAQTTLADRPNTSSC